MESEVYARPDHSDSSRASLCSVVSFAVPHFVLSQEDVLRLDLPELHSGIRTEMQHRAAIRSILQSSQEWIISRLDGLERPGLQFSLGSVVGNLVEGNDLVQYALGLADGIKALAGVQFDSVRLVKRKGAESSFLAVAEARATHAPRRSYSTTITTRSSYAKTAFGQQIYDATKSIRRMVSRGGPVVLNISYVTGLPRTWSRLWVPTVSAVFGPARDGNYVGPSQIVELCFDHRSVGEELQHSVQLTIAASPVKLT